MATYTLTAIDTTGIQDYIFGSNRLQENIGASQLVWLATGEWALQAVEKTVESHNVLDAAERRLDEGFQIESATGASAAEVLYTGGGNAVALFDSPALAREFAARLTRRVLEEAPGLSLVVAHADGVSLDAGAGSNSLVEVIGELLGPGLRERKAARLPSSPLLGLGVTAACQSTGLVATRDNSGIRTRGEKKNDEPVRLISREVEAKLIYCDERLDRAERIERRSKSANERLKKMFEVELGGHYKLPREIDQLSRQQGEESYVAVVHADGNRMGRHMQRIADECRDPRQYVRNVREFSRLVEEASREALRRLVRLLARSARHGEQRDAVGGALPIMGDVLPFRPLVFGGDDVTFLCNGRIGLTLASHYLRAFEEETEKLAEKNPYLKDLHASAGVAVVKMHYPFARAYDLSEKLADSAKKFVREKYGKDRDASALDWHFATGGLSGEIKQIRQREYEPSQGKLYMRPVLLRAEQPDHDGRSWEVVERLVVKDFGGEEWKGKRNKIKALRDALRQGKEAVEKFRREFLGEKRLPDVCGRDAFRTSGWDWVEQTRQSDQKIMQRCGYFDAIELLDHHLPLEGA